MKEFDAAIGRSRSSPKQAETAGAQGRTDGRQAVPAVKKQRVVKPADLVQTRTWKRRTTWTASWTRCGMELEQAIANDERIEIR